MPTPSFDEIRQNLVDRLNEIRDDSTGNVINIDPQDMTDVMAVMVNYVAYTVNYLLELQLRYRNTFNYEKAIGEELRDVVSYIGVTPKVATYTTTDVIFMGKAGTKIPFCRVFSEDETKIFICNGGEIGEDGSISINCSSAVAGKVLLNDNELVKTDVMVQDIASITNNNVVIGSDDETDTELKRRISRMKSTRGYGFIEILDSALMDIDGVRSASTFFDEPDKNIPYGHMTSVVFGGDDEKIAETIFSKNVFLYKTVGDVEIVKTTDFGNEYIVKFTRPTPKDIYVFVKYNSRSGEQLNNEDVMNLIYDELSEFLSLRVPGATIYASDLISIVNSNNDNFLITDCKVGWGAYAKHDSVALAWNEITSFIKENLSDDWMG